MGIRRVNQANPTTPPPPKKKTLASHREARGVRGTSNPPTSSNFMGDSESVKILGVQGILIMWQLVFALRHHLKSNNNKNNTTTTKKRVPDGHG